MTAGGKDAGMAINAADAFNAWVMRGAIIGGAAGLLIFIAGLIVAVILAKKRE